MEKEKPPIFGPARDRALALLADGAFYVLLALALLGLRRACSLRRPAGLILPFAFAYITLLHGMLFSGDPRFHMPLLPVLALLAASALLRVDLAPGPSPSRAIQALD